MFSSDTNVVVGQPFLAALRDVTTTDARIMIVVSRSLAARPGFEREAIETLRPRVVQLFAGISSHTPRADVISATRAARAFSADVLVACGGGSVVDAVKAIRLCLSNNIQSVDDMDRLLPSRGPDGRRVAPVVKPPQVSGIAIPTTLSAAEHTLTAGVTNVKTYHKDPFTHPELAASTVILDGELAALTPIDIWLSTGLRAVDHAVETWCSVKATPVFDAWSAHALRLLVPALRRAKAAPDDAVARVQALQGAWLSILSLSGGASFGLSHAIGHALGSVTSMAHGHTSSVMLPHALKFNRPVNASRQAALMKTAGLQGDSLIDSVSKLVLELGLPSDLRSAGVRENQLDRVAEVAIKDRWMKTNPRPIDDVGTLRQLLTDAY
jgi:maleylacetate reductase